MVSILYYWHYFGMYFLKSSKMLKSDLKAALRNILRNRLPSAISILGLGIGLGCIIILMALIIHEKSFDKFIPDNQNVYRILFGSTAQTHFPLAEAMAGEFPEVEDYFRYYRANSLQIKNNENVVVREPDFGFSDPSLFRVMGIKFISGGPAGSPGEVAISDESAIKYFGDLSPVGAVLNVKFADGLTGLSVSGVYKRFPSNSTLSPDFIADIKLADRVFRQFQKSLGDFGKQDRRSFEWGFKEFMSYVRLAPNTDPDALATKMEKYKELIKNESTDDIKFKLQPVSDIYLGSGEISTGFYLRRGNPEELKYYMAISVLILLISVANYILLSRAMVSDRTHELGTRKVFGASHGKIRRMIMSESNLIVLLSLIPASFIIDYGMTFINETLNKTMTNQVFLNPALWLLLIIVILLTGSLTGWLIGLNYSRIPALTLISGKASAEGRSNRWNYSFLVLHFTIFIMLVSGVIALSKQIRYTESGYTGIHPENVMVFQLNTDELRRSFTSICDEIEKIPGVEMTAGGSYIPPFGNYLPINLATQEGEKVRFDGLIMGEGMIELLGIEVVDGSSFGPYKQGPPEILFNESSARLHNVKAGERFLVFNVRGVVKDFHAHSLHTLIQPMAILQQNPERMGLIAIKTSGKNDEAVKKRMGELYAQISPDEIFEVSYLTDNIINFYGRERNHMRIVTAFSILATILSVMGLFGISLISISRRRKEIGIRKVNGATISEVLIMLNTDFIKWIIISIVIAVPSSLYLLNKWLERFAYRCELSWWIFAAAGLSAILVAILTVSWQSWRAATRNPVEALRYE
jgi:putative ABC transport system permease protein